MYFNIKSKETSACRNSIGGYPVLPNGTAWPKCEASGSNMVMFLQFDVPEIVGLGKGYHLTIFMSPEINEIPCFNLVANGKPLPEGFEANFEKHFKAYLFKGGQQLEEEDQYLVSYSLELSKNSSQNCFKVGGAPEWLQDAELPIGPKGEEFKFIAQIPEGHGFPKKTSAPEQPDSFSANDYCLFLGNQIYIFGSSELEKEQAIWVAVQG